MDNKIDLKYKSWNDVPISVYNEIKKVATDDELNDFDKTLSLLSILTGVSEDDLSNQPMTEINRLTEGMEWIYHFDFDTKWSAKKIKLNGNTYTVNVDMQTFTYSQYVDFQMLWKGEINETLSQVLTIFIIPQGKKYNEGYDIEELKNIIENYLPIPMSQSILHFFVKGLLNSINSTKTYLECQMKMMKMKNKIMRKKSNPKQIELMEQMIDNLNKAQQAFIAG